MAEPNERLRLLDPNQRRLQNRPKRTWSCGGRASCSAIDSPARWTRAWGRWPETRQLLKLTHDEAREILRHPEEEDARKILDLARETYADKLNEIAMN